MKMAPKYDVSAAIQPNLYDVSLAIPLGINSAFNSYLQKVTKVPSIFGQKVEKEKRFLVRFRNCAVQLLRSFSV